MKFTFFGGLLAAAILGLEAANGIRMSESSLAMQGDDSTDLAQLGALAYVDSLADAEGKKDKKKSSKDEKKRRSCTKAKRKNRENRAKKAKA